MNGNDTSGGAGHSEYCRDCKKSVGDLLTRVYGSCVAGHAFAWATRPADYRGTLIGETLSAVFSALGALRGFKDFIKAEKLPPCDFYVIRPGFIVEFDEKQHFTRPRAVALRLYGSECRVGFSVSRWIDLCHVIDARDPEPPDRDERRAWYDTLRDLLPLAHELRPTVRLYAGEFVWCSLDSGSQGDREKFVSVLNERLPEIP